MQSETLRKAREYESRRRPEAGPLLPVYHATGGIGWINDPNGFSLYGGRAHLFFQYYPYECHWGPMHWGHAVTEDFVRWQFLPAALAPDTEADRDGCFSGSAAALPDGRQLLLYTGVRKETRPDGGVDERQTQCVAAGDGLDYEKHPANPVIDGALLPPGSSTRDFRDPKLWREGEGFAAVVANLDGDGLGRILRYRSEDGFAWRYDGVLAQNDGSLGGMWECPDFFTLDGKAVLIHSAHDMETRDPEFHPGDGTVCHVGRLDDSGRLDDDWIQTLDFGLDFYAPQTLETADGRRVLIAWMQNWAAAGYPPQGLPFFGQMTLPRELFFRGGRLCQRPVRELERYRRNVVRCAGAEVGPEERSLPGIEGRCLDLSLRIRPGEGGYERFRLRLAMDERHYTELCLLPREGKLRLDRVHSGVNADVNHVRELPVDFPAEGLRLRLLLDRWSLELFVGDGEQTAAMTLYTPLTARGIGFSAEGRALVDAEQFEIAVEEQA